MYAYQHRTVAPLPTKFNHDMKHSRLADHSMKTIYLQTLGESETNSRRQMQEEVMAIASLGVGLQLKECEGLPQVKRILISEFGGGGGG
jgi:hypothetical protein